MVDLEEVNNTLEDIKEVIEGNNNDELLGDISEKLEALNDTLKIVAYELKEIRFKR